MLVSYFMITYSFVFGKLKGSPILLRAHERGWGKRNYSFPFGPAARKIRWGFPVGGQKGRGWGEGIFARPSVQFRFSRAKRGNQSGV